MSSEKCVKIQFSAVEFGPSQEISRVDGEYGHSLHIQGCPATIKKNPPSFWANRKKERSTHSKLSPNFVTSTLPELDKFKPMDAEFTCGKFCSKTKCVYYQTIIRVDE